MKNIRNIVFYVILILFSHNSQYSYAVGLRDEAKIISQGAIRVAKELAPALVDASKVVGAEASSALADGATEVAKIAAPALVDASRGIGSDVAKILAPYAGRMVVIGGVFAGAYSIGQLYPIGKEIYQGAFPTEKQKKQDADDIAVSSKRLAIFQAEDGFRECLLRSATGSERNTFGMPSTCEKAAEMLEMLGGEGEVARMTKVFMKYRK